MEQISSTYHHVKLRHAHTDGMGVLITMISLLWLLEELQWGCSATGCKSFFRKPGLYSPGLHLINNYTSTNNRLTLQLRLQLRLYLFLFLLRV
jgi:hypothetical protein